MMAVRGRAATAMAALDRRVPSLDGFAGQSWSSWIDGAGAFASEGCDVEECSKNGKKKVETMTLRKEDMSVFGQCPAHDEFYLVVCGHCGQVVKPQALEQHCENRHGPLGKPHGRPHPSPSAAPLRPRPGHALPHPAREGRLQGAGPPRNLPQPPPALPQHRPPKPLKEGVGCSPAVSETPPPSDSPPSPLSPGSREPPSENLLSRRADSGRPPDFPRTYSKTYKKVPRKDCDLDRHCGVMDQWRQKLCTRLLTCNIHSIHQRRQVAGRSRKFDQLVAELKMNSRVRERAGQPKEVPEGGSPSPDPPGGQTGPPHCRRRLVSCTGQRCRTVSENGAEEGDCEEDRDAPPLSRLSSEESEGEGPEDPPNLPTTAWHPKPLALCSFGGHALGRSVFTFDRRLHHLRTALSSMVEHHLSTHLWKKIPQATEVPSQRTVVTPPAFSASSYSNSQHSTASTGGAGLQAAASSLRTSAASSSLSAGREARLPNWSPSPGSASGVSEGKGGSQPISSPVPAKAAPPSPSGPARPRNPVGRPSKQQVRLREAERPSPTPTPPRKRRNPPLEGDDPPDGSVSSRTAPSPHGPINGALPPPGSKPRPPEPHLPPPGLAKRPLPQSHAYAAAPPADPSSRGRGGGPGPHRKAVSYDHKGLGNKRKSSAPPPLPPPSKLHRLQAAAHSGFFSWKKDGKGGGVSAGLEKKLSTQKPKLHH